MTPVSLAAANPEVRVAAIDFNPSHIPYAREPARAGGLTNVEFHECALEGPCQWPGPRRCLS